MTSRGLVVGLVLLTAVNMVALALADWLFDSVTIVGFWSLLIAGLVLGIANAILKPVLTLLTLPLVIVTFGLFLLVINIAMIGLAEWIAPDFSIDGFWTYVGVVIVVWLVNWLAGRLADSGARRRARGRGGPLRVAELDEGRAAGDAVARRHVHGFHRRLERRGDRVLHLHRLEHDQRLAAAGPCRRVRRAPRAPCRASEPRRTARRRGRRERATASSTSGGAATGGRRQVQPPGALPGGRPRAAVGAPREAGAR